MHGYAYGPSYTGFTLLEVLITIVIVALGLLGLGALHVRAMRDTTSAYLRSEATVLTQDIADRIRANLPYVRATPPSGNTTPLPYILELEQFSALAQPTLLCLSAYCTADQLETADLWQWREAVRSRLPSGQGKIVISSCVAPATGDSTECTTAAIRTWTITVYWDERIDPNKPEANCPAPHPEHPLFACLRVSVRP
ncbi:type IV pilus modification protein PilV [Plasticicumulans lactativorans]|uniref:type IV pilus modification protein PilV n=1 Tax=Plasticicumulans lactativorans TaxID=1133106 RepID=UPI003C78EC6A